MTNEESIRNAVNADDYVEQVKKEKLQSIDEYLTEFNNTTVSQDNEEPDSIKRGPQDPMILAAEIIAASINKIAAKLDYHSADQYVPVINLEDPIRDTKIADTIQKHLQTAKGLYVNDGDESIGNEADGYWNNQAKKDKDERLKSELKKLILLGLETHDPDQKDWALRNIATLYDIDAGQTRDFRIDG